MTSTAPVTQSSALEHPPDQASAAAAAAPAAAPSSAPALGATDVDFHHESPRFSVKDAAALQSGISYLAEHGYVVFSDVGNEAETSEAHDLFWKWATHTFPDKRISRHQPMSWEEIPCMGTGIVWAGETQNNAALCSSIHLDMLSPCCLFH
jgi:hypothetical protein